MYPKTADKDFPNFQEGNQRESFNMYCDEISLSGASRMDPDKINSPAAIFCISEFVSGQYFGIVSGAQAI